MPRQVTSDEFNILGNNKKRVYDTDSNEDAMYTFIKDTKSVLQLENMEASSKD